MRQGAGHLRDQDDPCHRRPDDARKQPGHPHDDEVVDIKSVDDAGLAQRAAKRTAKIAAQYEHGEEDAAGGAAAKAQRGKRELGQQQQQQHMRHPRPSASASLMLCPLPSTCGSTSMRIPLTISGMITRCAGFRNGMRAYQSCAFSVRKL